MSEVELMSPTRDSSQPPRDCSTPTTHLNKITNIAPDHAKEPQHVAEARSTLGEQSDERMSDKLIQEDIVDTKADVLEPSMEDLIQKYLASRSKDLKDKDASNSNLCIALVGPAIAGKSRLINTLLRIGPAEQERHTTTIAPCWPVVRPDSICKGPLLRDNMDILVGPPQYASAQKVPKTQDVKQLVRRRIKELEDLRRKKTQRSL